MRNSIKALCVAGLSLVMASPAFAGVKVYSSMRYETFYVNQQSDGAMNAANDDSVTTLQNHLSSVSRFGASFTEGNLSGQYEVGLSTGASNIYTRLIYGTYKFDGGSLLFGQTYSPWQSFTGQAFAADLANIGFGCMYDGRNPQIKISLDSGFWALVQTTNTSSALESGDVQYVEVPKIGVGFDGKAGSSSYSVGLAYNTYQEKNASTNLDATIDSYLVYARANMDLQPVNVLVAIHYGQNLSNFGMMFRHSSATLDSAGTDVDNNDGYGGEIELSTQLSENASLHFGAGYTHDDMNNSDSNQTTVWLDAPIKLAEHFQVVPEIDYFHFSEPSNGISFVSDGLPNVQDVYVFGAKWQMDF